MSFYRFGYQGYNDRAGRFGMPLRPTKPPHLQFGSITPSSSEKQLLLVGAALVGGWALFVRRDKQGKTGYQKLVKKVA